MSAFPDWQRCAVVQRSPDTGCIPWSYEILLRAAGAPNVDFATFQEDFDLDRLLCPAAARRNDFGSVAVAVHARYPHVRFVQRSFSLGSEKLAFLEARIAQERPTVVSIPLNGLIGGVQRGFHIMPIVDSDASRLVLLHSVDTQGAPQLVPLNKASLVHIHDSFDGGKEVAFLDC